MKNKPTCLLVSLLVFIGALNLGLVGLGGLLNMDLNVLNMLVGAWPLVENIVYLVVGLAALVFIVTYFRCCDSCACHSCDTKEKPAEPEPSEPEASTDTSSEAPANEEETPMGQ